MIPHGHLLLVVAVVSFASNWQFGFQITYINTASQIFYEIANQAYRQTHHCWSSQNPSENCTLSFTDWSKEWSIVVASFYPGTFVGFILVPYIVKRVGVKKSLLYSCYPAILGCFIQLLGRITSSLGVVAFALDLTIGRFFVGIQAGCSLCLLPLFIIEASPVENRPFLSSLQQVFQALSTLIGLIVGSETLIPMGHRKFEWLQVLGVIPTLLFIVVLYFLPNTPIFILDFPDRRRKSSRQTEIDLSGSLSFYYAQSSPDVISRVKQEAFERLDDGLKSELDSLKDPANKKGLIIGCLAAISFATTADDLIDSYSSEIIFTSNNATNFGESELLTIFLGILLFTSSVFGAFLIDRFSRRKLLIFGLLGTCLSNSLATFGFIYGSMVLQIVGFALTKIFIGFGAGAPAWFLTSELVSPKVTSLCQSISTGALLIATGFVTLVYLSVDQWIGVCSIFIMASIPALCLAIILTLFLPETKDKTHEEVREELLGGLFSGLGQKKRIYASERDLLLRRKNGRAESKSYQTWEFPKDLHSHNKVYENS